MNNNTEQLIPKQRFPEFKDDGEWEEKKLRDVATFENGKAHENNIVEDGKYIVVNAKFISSDGATRKYTNEAHCLAIKGDVLMVLSDLPNGKALAKCFYVLKNDKYTVNQRVAKITANLVECKFLYNILNRNPYLLSFNDGVKQTNLKNDDLLNCSVCHPKNKQEQQKIADCLTSLDDLIIAQEEKVQLLQDHKKGLMQNLFPKEGQAKPKFRFPEFRDDGEWISIPLIKTTDKNVKWSFIGGPFGSNLKVSDYTSKGIRIIQLQNIGDGFFNDKYKIYTSIEKADELLSNNIYSGDIIISKMGDPVGRACLIPGKNERLLMASDGIRLVVDESRHSKYFIFSLLNSDVVRNEINNKATGSTRKRIGLDTLKNILLQVPSNKQEQQKIAECLLSLDNLIEAETNKIEELRQHKKGLMQGLFPTLKE